MRSDQIDFSRVLTETIEATGRALLATWKWGALCLAIAATTGAISDPTSFVAEFLSALANLLASCAWGYAIYRTLRPGKIESRQEGVMRLFWASVLVFLLFMIVAFISGLFVIIVSALLIAISGYDPSVGDISDVDGSIAALRESGAIWIVYTLGGAFLAFLGWFSVRLILFGAATVGQGKILILQTWALTKSGFWSSAGLALLLIAIPVGLGVWASDVASQAIGLSGSWSPLGSEGTVTQPVTRVQLALNRMFSTAFGMPAFLLGHALASNLYTRLANHAGFK